MQRAIELARSLGIDEVVMDVWAFNEEARAFFTGCGFRLQMERLSMHLGE